MVLTFILTLSNKTDACLKVIADDFTTWLNLTLKHVSSYNLESHIHFE
jgi:hypothetical protein